MGVSTALDVGISGGRASAEAFFATGLSGKKYPRELPRVIRLITDSLIIQASDFPEGVAWRNRLQAVTRGKNKLPHTQYNLDP